MPLIGSLLAAVEQTDIVDTVDVLDTVRLAVSERDDTTVPAKRPELARWWAVLEATSLRGHADGVPQLAEADAEARGADSVPEIEWIAGARAVLRTGTRG